ncbi:MAG: zf-HC2 domain-containing protein [Candidatus Acidiferrales bacterium]
MAENGNDRESGKWSKVRPHEEYLELCAVSTTGELSDAEQRDLRDHLAVCAECRDALKEFEAVVEVGAPLLASALTESGQATGAQAPAESAQPAQPVFEGTPELWDAASGTNAGGRNKPYISAHRNGHRSHVNWNFVWMPFAAAIMLTVALGIYSYQVGKRRASREAQSAAASVGGKLDALERQLSDTGHAREILGAQLAERDRLIGNLRRELQVESADLTGARNAQAKLEASLRNALDSGMQLAQQQASANQALSVAQESLRKTESAFASLQQQRTQERGVAGSLEAQIKDLNGELRRTQQAVNQQQDLLADDRDIRNLMGARDLYIAEVYDVGRDGATRKPYGRVFYTKGTSLVFYAYDLDQQSGVRTASTFQAWGQKGPDREQALNLGIFYEDSVAKKRWVLKFDDPRALKQINAVFVTVEPRGGSHRPSGKPLLFASLRIDPNHP